MTKKQARDLTARTMHDVKIWTNECTACEHDYYRTKGALQEVTFMLWNATLAFGGSKIVKDAIKEIEDESDILNIWWELVQRDNLKLSYRAWKAKEEQR
mgnify:CR=1 FL=1|jgi:uncharacterized protein YpuA (DUF1002 family)